MMPSSSTELVTKSAWRFNSSMALPIAMPTPTWRIIVVSLPPSPTRKRQWTRQQKKNENDSYNNHWSDNDDGSDHEENDWNYSKALMMREAVTDYLPQCVNLWIVNMWILRYACKNVFYDVSCDVFYDITANFTAILPPTLPPYNREEAKNI